MTERPHFPAQQDWVCQLSIMMQSVLFAAVRAPDGLRKDHPIKVIMRWYRRSVLVSAFDGAALNDPFHKGGGSFTGPFTAEHVSEYCITNDVPYGDVVRYWNEVWEVEEKQLYFNKMRHVYLRHVDEMPHHFQLHLMHAAQIVGEFHPIPEIRRWWYEFYLMIVEDAHLLPEPSNLLKLRLSDNEGEWRKREVVTAR